MTTDAVDAPLPLFKKRGAKPNLRKRAATPPADSGSEYSSEDEQGHKIKRRRKTGVVTASSSIHKPAQNGAHDSSKFTADRSATIAESNDATKQSNWYDENLDEKSLLGTTRARASEKVEESPPDGTYKGAAGYSSFLQKNPTSQDKKVGPIKAPTNLRTITITDYAPDVCKDYKQTGFCGFGDSCKFLHAREDYKQGWALDRDWEISTKGKKMEGKVVASANRAEKLGEDDDEDDAALLEKIPFACIICKEPYKNPITTRCGHYFCESCALKRYRKNPNCAACGSGTNGVFNTAKTLHKLLERKRLREERLASKEGEDGQKEE